MGTQMCQALRQGLPTRRDGPEHQHLSPGNESWESGTQGCWGRGPAPGEGRDERRVSRWSTELSELTSARLSQLIGGSASPPHDALRATPPKSSGLPKRTMSLLTSEPLPMLFPLAPWVLSLWSFQRTPALLKVATLRPQRPL